MVTILVGVGAFVLGFVFCLAVITWAGEPKPEPKPERPPLFLTTGQRIGALLFVAAMLVAGQVRAETWTITREANTFAASGMGDILSTAPFDISVPLPGSTRWLLSGMDTTDAGMLFVLNESNAASYGADWAAIASDWAEPTNYGQTYFVHYTQGAAIRQYHFHNVNKAPGTTLLSVDMRFNYALSGSTPNMKFTSTTQFHAEGAPEPGSFALVMLAITGLSLFRYHTPHPARKYCNRS